MALLFALGVSGAQGPSAGLMLQPLPQQALAQAVGMSWLCGALGKLLSVVCR